MRSTFLLSLALTATASASAQNLPVLLAQSYYGRDIGNGGYNLGDTLVHMHSNLRNSTIVPGYASITIPNLYPNNGVYADDSTFVLYPVGAHKKHYYRKFNSAGLPTEFKTIKVNFTGAFVETEQEIFYSYNSAMLADTITTWNPGGTSRRSALIYNNGKLVEEQRNKWDFSINSWIPDLLYTYTALGSGSDSVYNIQQWEGTTYQDYTRHKYTRDAANRILIDSIYNANVLGGFRKYQYNAQGQLITDSTLTWDNQAQTQQFARSKEYRYDAQGKLTSTKNTGVPFFDIDSFTYNNYNQVTSVTSYEINNGTLSSIQAGQYYYYGFPVNVHEVATQSALQLYPVPANSHINLNMSFTKPQAFSVRIFDMQGRLVNQWQEPAQKDYNKQIPLTSMAPGQYTLHIWAGEESCSRQFSVLR